MSVLRAPPYSRGLPYLVSRRILSLGWARLESVTWAELGSHNVGPIEFTTYSDLSKTK